MNRVILITNLKLLNLSIVFSKQSFSYNIRIEAFITLIIL